LAGGRSMSLRLDSCELRLYIVLSSFLIDFIISLPSSSFRFSRFPFFGFFFPHVKSWGQDPGIFFVARPDGRAALTKGGSYGLQATLVPPLIGLFKKKCKMHVF
jgi:hypothetical protein